LGGAKAAELIRKMEAMRRLTFMIVQ